MPQKQRKKVQKGGTLNDYLDWRGDIGFDILPPNEIDCLIFSLITYVPFDGIVDFDFNDRRPPVMLSVAKKYLRAQTGKVSPVGLFIPREVIMLFIRAAKTHRFGLCRPCCYLHKFSNDTQLQFCAMTYLLPGGGAVVSYRGTDDTLVGWKECLNMSFMHPVPAQNEALSYINDIAAKTEGTLYLSGHSKGGNLAIYSYIKAEDDVRSRVQTVYNYDGPGFDERFIKNTDYLALCDKIKTIVPESSIIGMLLESDEKREVIKSTAAGIMQHNGLSWSVKGGSFLHMESTNEGSKNIDKSLKKWMSELSPEKREEFVDSLYSALTQADIKTLTDLNRDKAKFIKAWNSMTPEARSYILRCIKLVLFDKNRMVKENVNE